MLGWDTLFAGIVAPDRTHILFVTIRDKPSSTGFWLSAIDGSDMHCLGVTSKQLSKLSEVKWVPGGTKVSFACEGKIYALPAN